MPNIPEYIDLSKERTKIKRGLSKLIGKELSDIIAKMERETNRVFQQSGGSDLTITMQDLSSIIDDYVTQLQKRGRSLQNMGSSELTDLHNSIKAALGYSAPLTERILPAAVQDSMPVIREIRDILNKYQTGKLTPSRTKRLVQSRLRSTASTAYTVINTQIAGFDNEATKTIADIAGLQKAGYFGPFDPNIRIFCEQLLRAGALYTEAEIRAMDNGQGLSVLTNCGGFNCMHEWIWVDPEWKQINKIFRLEK